MAKKDKTDKIEKEKQIYVVSGRVFNAYGESIIGQNVMAMDVDLRGAAVYRTATTISQISENKGFEILGNASTNEDGYYEISFTPETYKKHEMRLADIIAFAVNKQTEIAGRSKLAGVNNYTGNAICNLDIRMTGAKKRGQCEYARLMHIIEPFVKDSKLELFEINDSDDQISFLSTEANQNRDHVYQAVRADKLRHDHAKSELSHELLYGIGRQNISLTWPSLIVTKKTEIVIAISRSISQNIIDPHGQKEIEGFVDELLKLCLKQAANLPETENLFKSIQFTLKDLKMVEDFARSYLQFEGRPEVFWKELSQKQEFTPEIIRSLQLTNQLSALTGLNTPLMQELQMERKIKDPSDLLELSFREWSAIVNKTGTPQEIMGESKEEKIFNYITGMLNLLESAYPTKKIALMVADMRIFFRDQKIRKKVSAFFKSAPEFDISKSRLTDFDQLLQKIGGKLYQQTVQHLELIQRIYQVSPSPEIMSILIERGYTSAYHIAGLSQNSFINTEAVHLGSKEIAQAVYNRARFQVARAQHILLKIRDAQDNTIPSKILTTGQQAQIIKTINS